LVSIRDGTSAEKETEGNRKGNKSKYTVKKKKSIREEGYLNTS
jgi:hypothetical protein